MLVEKFVLDLVDKSKLPTTIDGWSEYSLHQTHDHRANARYHIGGLRFHMGKGDNTNRNFPGIKRLLVAPFELSALIRWKLRLFDYYWEKKPLELLLKWASTGQMNELSDLGEDDWGGEESFQINNNGRVSSIQQDNLTDKKKSSAYC